VIPTEEGMNVKGERGSSKSAGTTETTALRLLTLRDVMGVTAMSRSAIYAGMAAGAFPQPIRMGPRAVRWIEGEVIEFITSRPRAGSKRRR
jgi:prophage regulatory protein